MGQQGLLILHLSLKAATVWCLANHGNPRSKLLSVERPSLPLSSSSFVAPESFHSMVVDNTPNIMNISINSIDSTQQLLATSNSLSSSMAHPKKDPVLPSSKKNDEPTTMAKLSRRIRVFWLAGQVFLSYKTTKLKESLLRRKLGLSMTEDDHDDHPAIVQLWDQAHQRNADRILKHIEQLQGFWIKVGQYLSSRADVMPFQYLQTLSSLQDGVPAKPFHEIEQTLSEQLTPQALAMIEDIDPNPLSTASIAQVHKATLMDGRKVVIKAQHRGVSSLMLQDMENLRTILQLLAKFEPDFDYNRVVEEYTKECRKELNFCLEAESMQHVREFLQKRNIRAIVPEVIPELVTEKVLVMEYCEGFPIRDLESLDRYHVDRHVLLERVCSAWAAQMHLAAVFNADPHAGNILVSTNQKDGDASVPILLDFGLTKRFTPEMKVAFARLVHSSYETDIDGLLQSFDEMGLKLNRYDPFQDMHVMQTAFSDPAPQSEAAEIKKQRVKDRAETEVAMREEQGLSKKQKLRNPVDAWPSELIFFSRVSAMLRGLCSRLEVRYPYLECMAKAASETLQETTPEHEHAVGVVYEDFEEKYDSKIHRQLVDIARQLIEDDHAIGMQVCVIHNGQIVANIAAGTLGTINPRPVTPASLFNVFSVSKAVLATGVLHMLQEKGISIDDPIAKHWHGWYQENPDKKEITIRHALTHQAGLADAMPSNASIETLTNWDYMKKFIAGPDAIPRHKPGTETHYHYLNFAYLLGGLLEEVTGQPYEEYLSEHLIKPLGLENELHMGGLPDEIAMEELAVLTARTMRDGLTEQRVEKETAAEKSSNERARLAKFRGREQLMNPSVFNMRKVRAAKIPSANGHASARALATLLDTCTSSNNSILSSKTLSDAITIQRSAAPRGSSAMLDNAMASFGLGYQIHELKDIASGKMIRSVGHAGFGGSIVISIPEKQLTVAFTTNQLKIKSVARNRVLKAILEEYGLDPPPSLVDS